MNEYKITYTVEGESDTYSVSWIERTEATARRTFLRNRKAMGSVVEVSGIELIRDDACATKQQERDTLAVIRKMVAELGPQSYLKTAFEGCFEIAEQNIEYDFGDSLKGRLECAEKEAKKLEADLKKVQADFDRLAKNTELDDRDLRAAISKTKKEASQTITSLRKQVLALDDLEDFHQLLDDRIAEHEERAEKAAQEIVKYAENPTGDEFKQAVLDNRNYTKKAEYYREVLGRVIAAETAAYTKSDEGGADISASAQAQGAKVLDKLADVARQFGFRSVCSGNEVVDIMVQKPDGTWCAWFTTALCPDGKVKFDGGSTDQYGISLHKTRPDMTPERCIGFFKELSRVLGLSGKDEMIMSFWIGPEDWKAIAGVSDAYQDERYFRRNEEGKQ